MDDADSPVSWGVLVGRRKARQNYGSHHRRLSNNWRHFDFAWIPNKATPCSHFSEILSRAEIARNKWQTIIPSNAMRFRKLRIAFSATCIIACALLIVLWVRSYWRQD